MTPNTSEQPMFYTNHNLIDIVTPVNVRVLERLLQETHYPEDKTKYLVQGFSTGFDIGYMGPVERQDTANNLPFQVGVGSKIDMWNKIMKEVKEKRYAGPFDNPPYDKFIQSPIGLVPKACNQTRLIFHLSYDFKNGNKSVNHHTPRDLCTVHYSDIDHAIEGSFRWKNKDIVAQKSGIALIFYSKTDLKSAFRILPLKPQCYCWLLMRAIHPITNKIVWFVDKNLPFGSSISCSQFQKFSDCLKHIVEYKTGRPGAVTNYLDDFLFIAPTQSTCNYMVSTFLQVCEEVGVPVSHEKTVLACDKLQFLGLILDGRRFMLTIPDDKKVRAYNVLNKLICSRSATIKELEQITGLLNFLSKAIVPGRTFAMRMYAKYSRLNIAPKLRMHHHIKLDREFKDDCRMWLSLLNNHTSNVISRPFLDQSIPRENAEEIQFHSDATANEKLGFGIIFGTNWTYQAWEPGFIKKWNPSIEFLELYAVCMGVFMWTHKLIGRRIILFCDNKSVCGMINSTVSRCRYCMVLIRKLTLRSMQFNCRIFAEHIEGKKNFLSDSLSRIKIQKFKKDAKTHHREIDEFPTSLNLELWPLNRFWELNCAVLNN